MALRSTLIIFTKEFRSYLSSPMAYIVISIFLALTGFFFGTHPATYSGTNLSGFLEIGSVLLLLLTAVLTMRLLAEEKKLGTIEILLTSPVRESEIILGKFLGSLGVVGAMLILTFYYPILLKAFGDPDPGPMAAGYLGLFLLSCAALAIGIFASTLTSNQIVAAVVGGGILIGLWFMGSLSTYFLAGVKDFIGYFSLSVYFPDFMKGVIDTRGIIYYVSVTVLFLFLAVRSLESSRWTSGRFNLKSGSLSGPIAILGLAVLAVGLVVMLLLPEIRISAWGILGVGIILQVVALILEIRQVKKAITGPLAKFGLGTGVLASIFFGIIIFINAISVGHYQRWDTSSLAQFTLTPQTIEVLKNLTKPVKVIGFFVPNDALGVADYTKDFLDEYAGVTQKLTVQYVDPDQNPDLARKYGVTEYNTVVFESGNSRRLVSAAQYLSLDETGNLAGVKAEYPFTSALLEVTGVAQKKVYFLTGHGEAGTTSAYSKAIEGIKQDLYKVNTLNLVTNPSIPEDIAVLIIAAPKNALSSNEVNIINNYLNNGGQALILTDPGSQDNIGQIISSWGVEIREGSIVDPGSSVSPYQYIPMVPTGRNYFGLPAVYFPGAAPIIPREEAPENVQIVPLVYTDPGSWLDKDFEAGKDPVFDAATEKKESLAVGVLIAGSSSTSSAAGKLARLVIIGDSDFASNEHFDNANNSDLFLNSVSWLAEETSLISIRRNVEPFRRLVVTPSQARIIQYSSFLLFPVLLMVAAIVIWWRRR